MPACGETRACSAAEQGVEQPALAGVGGAGEHDPGRRCGAVAARQPKASARVGADGGQFLGQLSAAEGIDVGLVDEVEVGLEVGQDVEQAVAEPRIGPERPPAS